MQLVSEKCESESDIRRQEFRLKQINAKLKCIGTELKQRRQALKQRHARLFNWLLRIVFKKKTQTIDMDISYYSLYLKRHLQEVNDPRASDKEFIDPRAELAAQEYEDIRRGGASVDVAQESAMGVLLDGLEVDD